LLLAWVGEARPADLSDKRRVDEREGTRDIARDERRLETHDAVPALLT